MLIALFMYSGSVYPVNDVQSHEDIIALATQFAADTHSGAEKVEISIPPLDQRLVLPQCTEELEVFQPRGSTLQGLTTIGVRCANHKPWTIRIRAEIKVFDYIAVLATTVRRGDEITPENVMLELTDRSTLRGDSMTDFESLIGYRFKRRYPAFRALNRSMLDMPRLIQKGQKVAIITENSSIRVRMKGVALTDGARGNLIQVRNLSSGRVIEGIVDGQGVVKVQL